MVDQFARLVDFHVTRHMPPFKDLIVRKGGVISGSFLYALQIPCYCIDIPCCFLIPLDKGEQPVSIALHVDTAIILPLGE